MKSIPISLIKLNDMDPITIAGIASAVASLAGSVYSNYKNSKNLEKQNQFNLSQWHMMNQYNQPVEQVQRLREAGINPALALGNISVGNASGSVQSGTPQPTLNPLQDVPNIVGNTISQSMQYDLMQKQKQSLDADISLKQSQEDGNKIVNDKLAKKLEGEIALNKELSNSLHAKTALDEQLFENNLISFDLRNQLDAQTLENLRSQKSYLDKQLEVLDYSLKKIMPLEAAQIRSTIAMQGALTRLYKENAISEEVYREASRASAQLIGQQFEAQRLQNKWTNETWNTNKNILKTTLDNMQKNGDLLDYQVYWGWMDAGGRLVKNLGDAAGAVMSRGASTAVSNSAKAYFDSKKDTEIARQKTERSNQAAASAKERAYNRNFR